MCGTDKDKKTEGQSVLSAIHTDIFEVNNGKKTKRQKDTFSLYKAFK